MSEALTTLRARFVFPVEGQPIPGGAVTIADGRIASVGQPGPSTAADLGNVALVPGFVNAHTHLEFSDLEQPVAPGRPFADWIRRVVAVRRERGTDPQASLRAGLAESAASGTTLVGEIATPGWDAQVLETAPIASVVFLELIGLSDERADAQARAAAEHLARPPQSQCTWALSPHAPYSVRPSLFHEAVRLARANCAPLAIHLAESREELELLAWQTGPFVSLLKDLGAWDGQALPPGRRPRDFLREMTALPRGLVIHGNYLDEEEIALLARHRDNLSVVYCPRTHAYFGHAEHPFRRMLTEGVRVAVGTDSRASNPDLSVLEELRFVHRRHPDLPGNVLLKLGTLAGARALGLYDGTGTLGAGKRADLAAIALPDREEADPHRLLFDSELPVIATMSGGRWVFGERR